MRRFIASPRGHRQGKRWASSSSSQAVVPFGLTDRLRRALPPRVVMQLVMPQAQGLLNRPTWQRSEAAQQQRAFADSRENPRCVVIAQNVLEAFAEEAGNGSTSGTSADTSGEGPDFGRPPGAALLGPIASSQYEVVLKRHGELRSFLSSASDLFVELFGKGLPFIHTPITKEEDIEALDALLHSHILETLKKTAASATGSDGGSAVPKKISIKRVLGARIVDMDAVWDGTAKESDLENNDEGGGGGVEADERGHSIALSSDPNSLGIFSAFVQRFSHYHGLQPPRRVVSQITVAFVCEEEHDGVSVGTEMEWPPAVPLEAQEARPLRSAFADGVSLKSLSSGGAKESLPGDKLTKEELEAQQKKLVSAILKSAGFKTADGKPVEVKVGVGGVAGPLPFFGSKTFTIGDNKDAAVPPKDGEREKAKTEGEGEGDGSPATQEVPSDDKPLSPPSLKGPSGPHHRRSAGTKAGGSAEASLSGHRTALAIMTRLLGDRFTSMLPASVCAQLKLKQLHSCGPEAHDLRKIEFFAPGTPSPASSPSSSDASSPGIQYQSLAAPWDAKEQGGKKDEKNENDKLTKEEFSPVLVIDGVGVAGDALSEDGEGADGAADGKTTKKPPKEKKRVTVHTVTFEGSVVNERVAGGSSASSFSASLIARFPLARYLFAPLLKVEQPWRVVDIDGHFSEASSGKQLSWSPSFASSSGSVASHGPGVLTDSELMVKAKELAHAGARWESELSFAGIQDHVAGIRPFSREAEAVARALLQLHACVAKNAPRAVEASKKGEERDAKLFYRAAARSGVKGLAIQLQMNPGLLESLWNRPLSVAEAAEAVTHIHAISEELLSLAQYPFWVRMLRLEGRIEQAIETMEKKGTSAAATTAEAAAGAGEEMKTTAGSTVSGVKLPRIFRPFAPGSAVVGGRFLVQPHGDRLELTRMACRIFPAAARHLASLDPSLSVEQPFQGQYRLAALDSIAVFGIPAAADALLRLRRSVEQHVKAKQEALAASFPAAAEKLSFALSELEKDFGLTADDADADEQVEKLISLQYVDSLGLMGSDDKKGDLAKERKELMQRIEKSARALQKGIERIAAINANANASDGQATAPLLADLEDLTGGWESNETLLVAAQQGGGEGGEGSAAKGGRRRSLVKGRARR